MAGQLKRKRKVLQAPVSATVKAMALPQAWPLSNSERLHGLDALRGGACCLMLLYHLCFDLNYLGFLQNWGLPAQTFNQDAFWLTTRSLIVSLFLVIVGYSLQLNAERNFQGFWQRCGQLLGCACAVSLGSAIVFPQSWIFFGILHCILLASLIGRPLASYPALCWLLAGAILTLHVLWQSPLLLANNLPQSMPWFDQSAWLWLGLVSEKPYTEDYVPLVPWLACVLLGMALAHLPNLRPALAKHLPAVRPLAWLGRHSLSFYMLHQPVLLGLLFVWKTN